MQFVGVTSALHPTLCSMYSHLRAPIFDSSLHMTGDRISGIGDQQAPIDRPMV